MDKNTYGQKYIWTKRVDILNGRILVGRIVATEGCGGLME
jgi:hypothetical protein